MLYIMRAKPYYKIQADIRTLLYDKPFRFYIDVARVFVSIYYTADDADIKPNVFLLAFSIFSTIGSKSNITLSIP